MSGTDEDEDRLRYLFARAFEDALPSDDCPAPEVLLDAASGVLELEQRGAVVDHIGICPVCAEAWRLAALHPMPPEA